MFTQACFIMKNTSDIRNKLEVLGYKYIQSIIRNKEEMLFANNGYFSNNFPYNAMLIDRSIDCETNEDLFLALAALRDEEDYMQWFTNGKDFILCDRQDWIDMYSTLCSGGKYTMDELDRFHKATVQELIQHFKDK